MTDVLRTSRYRQLFVRLGDARARDLLDNLQVLALTRPDTVRELEAFIDRNAVADIPGNGLRQADEGPHDGPVKQP
jgi:hypothetical protein